MATTAVVPKHAEPAAVRALLRQVDGPAEDLSSTRRNRGNTDQEGGA
ncbi:hypothetical protein [Burkholderia ambifaria]|nr:hypothetical protein [Burkholderia ambifaria]